MPSVLIFTRKILLVFVLLGLLWFGSAKLANASNQPEKINYSSFVEVDYEICARDKCSKKTITEFPPVGDLALAKVKLHRYFPTQSVLFLKSSGCAGTYLAPQENDYYSTNVILTPSEEYKFKILGIKEIPQSSARWRLKLEKIVQNIDNEISYNLIEPAPCQSLTRLKKYETN